MKIHAKALYRAYSFHTGGKSAVTGARLPKFDDCPKAVKAAWNSVSKYANDRLTDFLAEKNETIFAQKKVIQGLTEQVKNRDEKIDGFVKDIAAFREEKAEVQRRVRELSKGTHKLGGK